MTKKTGTRDPGELRRQAEKRLPRIRDGAVAAAAVPESAGLVHELQVHQVELEMQNEELQQVRADLEESLSRFTNLYESAPVGYLTFGRDGTIRQVNLTGARLLGLERTHLVGRRMGVLLAAGSRPVFDTFLGKVWGSESKEACEVVLHAEGAPSLALELTGTAGEGGQECRVVASDISERKRAEERIKAQVEELQRWHDVMLGREDRVQELKREVNQLCHRLGEPARYPSQQGDPAKVPARKPGSGS